MATKHPDSRVAQAKLERAIKTTRMISTVSLAIGIIAIILAAAPLVAGIIKGPAPNFGHTLAGINQPLTPSQLAVINNASNANFETAGLMYLNHSLQNASIIAPIPVNSLTINGKPSVIYLGAISCIYCAENRWAMALALGQFGHFNSLYLGYSALGDGDVPTIYWAPAQYNSSSGATFGANYSSSYINFLPIEGQSKITGGFVPPTLSQMQQDAQSLNNSAYSLAINTILQLNNFQGTPYTIWGRNLMPGVDAVAGFAQNGTGVALTYMTHAQVFSQLNAPNGEFSWTQYAGADLYIAMTCASINNTAPICSLPAIQSIERINGY